MNKESFSLTAASPDHTGRNGDIPVISFESLLAMKIYALKDDEHRQGKDLLDIRFLMDFNKGKVSEEQLQALCLKYGGNGSYDLIRNRI